MNYTDRSTYIFNTVRDREVKIINKALDEEIDFWRGRQNKSRDAKEKEILRNRLSFLEKIVINLNSRKIA